MKNKHNKTIEKIISSPDLIGENKKKIMFMLKEPIYLFPNSNEKQSMCDLIIGYINYAIPVEVKGTDRYLTKAMNQVLNGEKYIRDHHGLYVPYRKIVYYAMGNNLNTEVV